MKRILGILMAIAMGLGTIAPASAVTTNGMTMVGADNAVILKECGAEAESGSGGEGVLCVLGVVVNILTVGIGVLGVLGIVIVGIQYLTAGGNEEQTRKAKRRMLEIVIGLVVYVLAYALLQWLLPGFNL